MTETVETGPGSDGIVPATPRTWLRYALTLVVAGLLVYAVVVASGGLRDALRQLRHASPIWLLPALALETTAYAAAGWLLWLLRGENDSLSWGTTTRIALVRWGLGSLLPASPTEGIALSVSELGRRGATRQRAVAMLFVAGWCQFWALVLTAAMIGAVLIALKEDNKDNAGGQP